MSVQIDNSKFPLNLTVNYSDVSDKFNAKVKTLAELGDSATDRDRSFNVQLKDMVFNDRNVSALLTLSKDMDSIDKLTNLKFTRVVKYSDKLKTDVMFYTLGGNEGECTWKAV